MEWVAVGMKKKTARVFFWLWVLVSPLFPFSSLQHLLLFRNLYVGFLLGIFSCI